MTQDHIKDLKNVRHALDQSAIVAITDRAGNIIHVNEKFCKISQYTQNELLGKNHRIINSGHHPHEFFVNMWGTISRGEIWEGEIRNQAKDGSYYWVNTTIVPFLDEAGIPAEYVSIRYDITQRKTAEEGLRVYAERLELSNQELQNFASIAAHDMQEPLRKIQTFGDRLLKDFRHHLPEEGQDYLRRMLASSQRMRTLIDDLLSYSRVTTKAKPFETTDMNRILNEVLSDLEVRIEQLKAEVEINPLPTLRADPSQMRQLVQNLISNALKFHQPGMNPKVKISARCQGNYCVLSFEDNGIGFEDRFLDRIFTIFQRLHGRHEYEGNGVGLAICRRIVERHGGTISATSTVGRGSEFIVSIPKEPGV